MSKSVLIPIGEVPELDNLAQFFGCGVDSLPSSYLGLPLGASFKSKVVWEPVVERFRKKLAGWKSVLLRRGGRLTLLKSSLWSLPIYLMSLFTIPVSIARSLEKIMRDFLWPNNGATKGLHWVNWREVCRPKHQGGLGIRPLCQMNAVLMIKWIWRFAKEEDAFWRKVVVAKYGVEKLGWWSKKSHYAHGVGCWKSILGGLELFKNLVCFQIGNGNRVLFWQDVWYGESSPKSQFSNLYRMAHCKEATVDQMFITNGEHIHWDLSFVRRLNDWEEESVCNLLAILAAREVKAQVNDKLVWPLDPRGSFNIKSFCKVVYDRPLCPGFPSTAIWRSKAPPKACFFAWAAALEKVPTEDFLKRRNFHGRSRCVLCREEEETVHHLLVHCHWAYLLW